MNKNAAMAYPGMPAFLNTGYGPAGPYMAMPYRAITDPSDVFVSRLPGTPWFDNLNRRVYAPALGGGIFGRGGIFGLGDSGDGLGALGAVPLGNVVNLTQALEYAEGALAVAERAPAATIAQQRDKAFVVNGYRWVRDDIRALVAATPSWTRETLLSATQGFVDRLRLVDEAYARDFTPPPGPGPAPPPPSDQGGPGFSAASLFSGPMLFVVGGVAAYMLARAGKRKSKSKSKKRRR